MQQTVPRRAWACAFVRLLSVGAPLLLSTAQGCDPSPSASHEPRPAPAEAPPAEVQTAVARIETWPRVLRVAGNLEVQERSTLGTKVPGRLEEIRVDVGSIVAAGDLLAKVDDTDYRLSVERARAQVLQARALLGLPAGSEPAAAGAGPMEDPSDLGAAARRGVAIAPEDTAAVREALAVRDEANARFERTQALRDQNIATVAELDVADAAARVAEARLSTATQGVQSQLAALQARHVDLALAETELEQTAIVAPYAGVVVHRIAGRGDYLSTGAPVLELVRMDPLRLRIEVPERDGPLIRPGQRIRFQIEGGDETLEASVSRIPPELDAGNRSLQVEADVPNPVEARVHRMRAGSFVEASIVLDPDATTLVVPASALRSFAGIERVLVVEEGRVRERLVTVGRRDANRLEVLAGVVAGERVIVEPGSLTEGRAVTVME